ncbi:restriction endonuclease subunit S [Denitrificimonas caeni]|uniref:restriction endonuclease subunit S n=1 Tax=Denitrificimonas caeni TaxID=521720 RepID=UPI0019657EC7|nr:restriction endonuclease subunit S [Denitrificimonas caeni]
MSKVEQLITEHIDIWTSSILAKSTAGRGSNKKYELYGIKKLRELIFELAIRGKLVQQDPKDVSGSALRDELVSEKKMLVKEGKARRSKTLPAITNHEKLFDLPENWQWVRVADIGNVFNGNSISSNIKKSKYSTFSVGMPYIATKDVEYGFDSLNYNNGINIPHDEPKFKVAHKGAVLICAEGGSAGKKCGIAEQDIYFGNKLFANELFSGVLPKYILTAYLSPTFYEHFSELMTGIIGGISLANFMMLPIPLPPTNEQLRIVSKVDELMLLCDQLEQETESSIDAHATLVDVLLAALTDSADTNELAQNWARLSEYFDILFVTEQSIDALSKKILEVAVKGMLTNTINVRKIPLKKLLSFGPRNGFSPKEVNYQTSNKVLALGATTTGRLLLEKSKYFEYEIPCDSHLWLSKDDILIQRGNAASYVGSSIHIEDKVIGYIYPDLMIKIRASDEVDTEYLSIVLSSPASREFMWDRMTGTSGTMPKINQKTVESVPIPLPDLKNQRLIVSIVSELMEICEQLKINLQQSQETQVQFTDALVDQALV